MASSTFDPNTGQWSDGSGPAGIDGGNPETNPATTGAALPPWYSTPTTVGGGPAGTSTPADNTYNYLKTATPAVNPGTTTQPTTTTTPTASSQYPTDLGGWQSYNNPTDQGAIQAYAQWLSQQPGADPLIASQVGYLAQRISETGGLTSGNVGYWATRTQAGNWTAPENNAPSSAGQPQGLYGGLTQPQDQSGNQDAINAALLKLLQTPTEINPTTVAESPEAVAERLQSQRGAERQIAAAAEQAAQSGVAGTGGEEGLTRQILGQQSEQDATFQGQLASTQRQQQIQQLEYGLQLAINSGQFDKAQQLQAQIAELNAGLQSDQLGYNYAALQQQSNQNIINTLMGL